LYVAAFDDVGRAAPQQWVYARTFGLGEEGYVPSTFLSRVTAAAVEIETVRERGPVSSRVIRARSSATNMMVASSRGVWRGGAGAL
jgi:hypothetical protein